MNDGGSVLHADLALSVLLGGETMANWRTLQDKDYLGAYDLVGKDGKPRDVTVKIASVQSGLLKTKETPKGKRKVVIRFERAQKAMVANSTNCKTIEAMYGADVDGWVGKTITLYQGETRDPSTGGQIACIRVRPQKPKGAAEELVGQPVDQELRDRQERAFEGANPDDDGR